MSLLYLFTCRPKSNPRPAQTFTRFHGMLTQSQIARYLLGRDLISTASLVGSDFVVTEASCRNRNFRAGSSTGPSYFLKQGVGSEATRTVAHEARVYRFLNESPEAKRFLPSVPPFVQYDAEGKVLILESLREARDLREHVYQTGRFPISAASALGRALSRLHLISASDATARAFGMEERLPWILSIHRPGLFLFQESSASSLEMMRIIQSAGPMPALLDELKAGWRANAFIHNDIKWDNCLLMRRRTPDAETRLKVIDWELANLGDSCWDIGAVFAAFLSLWILSMPVSGQGAPDEFLHLARHPLERIHPPIKAFWRAYVAGLCLDRAESAGHLLRAVRYAAARLLQTAFEQTQHSAALSGNIICLLQLSSNILERPRGAVAQLLGLSER